MSNLGHLARRWVGSLSPRPPDPADAAWAESYLRPGELALWRQLSNADRRHAIDVARRFAGLGPWPHDEMAGALLHDIGKLDSGFGTTMRVVATLVGPRTARLRRYHDHEAIGAAMLEAAGSSAATVELVEGRGPAAEALRRADDL